MPTIRAFIAIESSRDVLDALARMQSRLRLAPGGDAARWVRSDDAHLTVKFLGDVPSERVEALSQAMDGTCARQAPFTLHVAGLGCFPNTRRPRVVWVGVREETGALLALQSELETALEALGFAKEQRAYAPHLTLGRVRQVAARGSLEMLGQSVVAQQDNAAQVLAQMQVTELTLFKSDLRPEGPLHTALHRAALKG